MRISKKLATEDRGRLTEESWHSSQYVTLQRALIRSGAAVRLDFSRTQWFDLWPLAHLTKLLHDRLHRLKSAVLVSIPFPGRQLTIQEKHKPLCFLVDIGFLGLLTKWGATFTVAGSQLQLKSSNDTTSGLSEKSLDQLTRFGYRRKTYKDQILVPLTPITNHGDVDRLKAVLHAYVDNWLKFFEHEIAEGNFIDIFYRELAENIVEHAHGATGFVAARLIRSIWDLPQKQRKGVHRRRVEGKLAPMRHFLRDHENDGFLELVVVDDGPGIRSTLPIPNDQERRSGGIYRYAMQPDVSRYSRQTRLERGKSPQTGLAACAGCLEHLPGVLMFQESQSGAYCYPTVKALTKDLASLKYSNLKGSEYVRGCNIQLALAISPLSLEGEKVTIGNNKATTFDYISLLPITSSSSRTVKSQQEFSEFILQQHHSKCIVDLSGASADKDTAWHVLQRLFKIQAEHQPPLILVGVTRPFAARLNDAINEYFQDLERKGAAKPASIGWLTLSQDLQLQFVGGTSQFSDFVRKAIISRRFPLSPTDQRQNAEHEFYLCDRSGNLTATPEDLFWSWQEGTAARIMQIAESKKLIIQNACIELTNHAKTERHLDIYSLCQDSEARLLLIAASLRELHRVRPQVVVTYSAFVRQLCSEILRRTLKDVIQVDFPTPYTSATALGPLKHYKLRNAMVFADIIDSGSHAARIVHGCQTAGINVLSVLSLLDCHTADTNPDCGASYFSILRYPNAPIPRTCKTTHVVDPYTLAVNETSKTPVSWVPVVRTKEQASEFYNTVEQQKALICRHSVNPAGHHFTVAVDFRQLIRPEYLSYLVKSIRKVAKGCTALVCPSESIIGGICDKIAAKLNIASHNIIWAIEARRIVKEHRFSSADELKLLDIANKGENVLFLDDAIHQGKTLYDVAAHIAHCGIARLHAWFVLDNRPPGSPLMSKLDFDDGVTMDLVTTSLLRSYFPAFGSAIACPHCKTAEAFDEAIKTHPNGVLEEYINTRLSDIRPIDIKTAVLDPWRYSASQTISLAPITSDMGLPDLVYSHDALYLALLELSQYEEGISFMHAALLESRLAEHNTLLALILSRNVATLERLALRRSFGERIRNMLRNWSEEYSPELLETLLLWPVEVLADEIVYLLEDVTDSMLGSDSYLATLYALLNRLLTKCRREDSDRITAALKGLQGRIERDAVTYGLAQSMIASFTNVNDTTQELKRSLGTLAKHLMIHRQPWHRIQEQIPNLASTLTTRSAYDIVGRQGNLEAIETFAVFYFLAELRRSLKALVTIGELNYTQCIKELDEYIKTLLEHRAELRDKWQKNQRPPAAFIDEKVASIKQCLLRICEYLVDRNSQKYASDLFILLENRVVHLMDGFVTPLSDSLNMNKLEVRQNEGFRKEVEHVYMMLDPSLLLRVISSLSSNVSKYVTRPDMLPPVVGINGTISIDGTCAISIENECSDGNAERKFFTGADYHSLSSALYRFGVRYSGKCIGRQFVTEVRFSTII